MDSTDMEQIASKTFPQRLFHRTRPSIVVANKEEKAKMMAHGFTSRYLHEEFPVVVYHKTKRKTEHGHTLVALSKTVKDADEEEALGPDWTRECPPHVYTDTEGMDEVGDKHVRYLQSRGFRITDVPSAQLWYSQLGDEMQKEFLDQVETWDEKELPFESDTPKTQVKKKKKKLGGE